MVHGGSIPSTPLSNINNLILIIMGTTIIDRNATLDAIYAIITKTRAGAVCIGKIQHQLTVSWDNVIGTCIITIQDNEIHYQSIDNMMNDMGIFINSINNKQS